MTNTVVYPIPAFNDNYIWAIVNGSNGVVVDPGQAGPVFDYFRSNQLTLDAILITHHHADHTGGVSELKKTGNVTVYGPADSPFTGSDVVLQQGDEVMLDSVELTFEVHETPGHTLDHICYYSPGILFCGDTLFSAGCGRLFEGTPEQMLASLDRLSHLEEDTKVYCAHEYTMSNLQFAIACESNNQDLQAYLAWVTQQRQNAKPTLPSTIGREKKVNPFLGCDRAAIKKGVANYFGKEAAQLSRQATFTLLRQWKNQF